MRIRRRSGFLPIGPPWFFANSSERRMSTELPILHGWTSVTSMMIYASNGLRLKPIEGCSSRWVTSNWIKSACSQVLSKLTGSNSLLRDTWQCFPLWSRVSLKGCSKSKVLLLGRSPELKRSRSLCSFVMNTLWTIGIQRSMLCPQCGLMFPWWGPTTFAKWLVTTFITCGRSTEYLVCGVMFARGGGSCNSTLRQLGRDGIQWRRERRDSSPTGPINRGMIWRMKSGLMTIGMRGESGGLLGTDYGDYVSQAPLCSFLVSTGFLRAFMTRYERKSMLYRYSSLEVSKMCQLAERKRGSKPKIPLLARSCFLVHWTLTISCWRRSESRGCVDSRESLSLFHLFTMIGLGQFCWFVLVGGGLFCLVLFWCPWPFLSHFCLPMTTHYSVQWLPRSWWWAQRKSKKKVGQLISSCWRAGENAKDWMSNNKPKTGTKPKHTKQTHHSEPKRTSSELSETVKLRFRTRKILGALSTPWRRHSNILQVDCTQSCRL